VPSLTKFTSFCWDEEIIHLASCNMDLQMSFTMTNFYNRYSSNNVGWAGGNQHLLFSLKFLQLWLYLAGGVHFCGLNPDISMLN
jgi:hypothetical protein